MLTLEKERILTTIATPWFESTDCTGQAWIDGDDATRGIISVVGAITSVPTGIRTFYVSDPLEIPQTISRRSLIVSGQCEPGVAEVSAARVTPVDLDAMFTPRFRVTTLERLLAQP